MLNQTKLEYERSGDILYTFNYTDIFIFFTFTKKSYGSDRGPEGGVQVLTTVVHQYICDTSSVSNPFNANSLKFQSQILKVL